MRRFALLVVALPVSALAVFQACTSREVVGIAIGGIGIQPPSATVYVGDSVHLTAVVQDDRGEVIVQAQPDWTSRAASVVAVNQAGVVRGLRSGTAEVAASFGGVVATARIVVTPLPVFDFAVSETAGSSVVNEAGSMDELSAVLLTQPSSDVVLRVTSGDPGEVSVSPPSLTFTSADWDEPQTVSLTGEDDEVIDGDRTTDVTVAVDVALSDEAFASAPARTVSVLTRDDESPGFTLAATGGGTSAAEGGTPDTVTVVLGAQPSADVRIALSVDDPQDAAVSPDTLTFTSTSWDEPQAVAFSAVDDALADGTRSRTITARVASGSDAAFASLPPRTLNATTVDDELASWTLAHTGGGTVAREGGASDSISVTLVAAPASAVVLDVAVQDSTDVRVAPASLIFTSGGPTSQWVTVSAVDDPALDGDRQHTVSVSVNPASDPAFLGSPTRTIEVATSDDDVAGYTVTESGGVTMVDERGGTDTFTLVLAARPTTSVGFQISSDDLSETTVAPTTLTFAPSTWNQPQTVTVTGVDDAVGDGDQSTEVTVAVAPGSNAAFAGLPPRTVTVTTVDDDGIGFTLGETDGTVVNEAGTLTDAIAVRLNAVPLANVVLAVASADTGEVTVQPKTLTFTPANGAQPQAVVVTGVNDLIADGDVVTQVTVSVDQAQTQDAAYDTVSARSVSVTTLDDETPNIVVTETGGGTSVEESGTTDAFTVILSAQPLSDVTLTVTSTDVGEVLAGPATLTFTPSGWSTPQTVTVTGVDDGFPDGDQVSSVVLSVDDGSSDDAWDDVPDRSVAVTTTEALAGVTVTQTGGSTSVHESGVTDVVAVVLDGRPDSDVVLAVATSDAGEVVADSTTVTFTPSNWSTPKTVTLTGVDDPVVDGTQTSQITFTVAAGSDPDYLALSPEVVTVTTTDDEVASFTVTETGGSTSVDERGSTDQLLVVLDAEPQSNVVLTVVSGDPGEAVVDSTTLTFTPSSWSTAKTVTVTGVEDGIEDGDQFALITVAVNQGATDDLWDAVPNETVVARVVDVSAAFTVTETGGSTSVDESGTTDTFLVGLTEPPTSNVVMTVVSEDVSEVVADSATLTFTPQNWSTAKTVTVRGVQDGAVDGPQITDVTLSVLVGSDPAYVGLPPEAVSVTTTDDDLAGFEVTETGGTTSVDESGTTDVISVVLSAEPLSNVILTVTSAAPSEVEVDSATLTFTPATWSTPKTVTVSGANDDVADGSQFTDVTIAVGAGSDAAFLGLGSQTVSVETTDDEVADFLITQSGGSTSVTEGGSSDSFTVVLRARPTSSVTLRASSPDGSEVTVSPASVSFPPGQWSNPRTFTVTGVDDGLVDGNQVTLVVVAVDDDASNDVFDSAPDQTVAVTTVDDDVPGFTLTESGGDTSVDESGTTDTFTVVLDGPPVADVVLSVTTGDATEVAVETPTVTFTPSDWSQPKTVTVRGVADGEADGPQLTDVTVAVAPASHAAWLGLAPQVITVNTTDAN